MAPMTAEDRLLIKAVRIKKGWNVDWMIVEFPARVWKQRTSIVKKSMALITWNVLISCWDTISQELINAAI